MWNDPVVEQVHAARRQLLTRAKGDLRKVIDAAARRQKAGDRVVLDAAPRAPASIEPNASKRRVPASQVLHPAQARRATLKQT